MSFAKHPLGHPLRAERKVEESGGAGVRYIFTWDVTNPSDSKPVPPSLLEQG